MRRDAAIIPLTDENNTIIQLTDDSKAVKIAEAIFDFQDGKTKIEQVSNALSQSTFDQALSALRFFKKQEMRDLYQALKQHLRKSNPAPAFLPNVEEKHLGIAYVWAICQK